MPTSHFSAINCDIDFLLAPTAQQWLPEDHLARYIVGVVKRLDLCGFGKCLRRAENTIQ